MSSNIELRLFALMMKTGDFGPIIDGTIHKDTCVTDAGKILFNFVTTFRHQSGGRVRYPSLAIAQNRFSKGAFELPEPDAGDDLGALVHEVILQRFRTDVLESANTMTLAAETSDDLYQTVDHEINKLKAKLQPLQRSHRASLQDYQDVLAGYDDGDILSDGIPWGWPSMTKATRGLQKKEFYVIAGRPKARKTFVATAVGAHVVSKEHKRCLFISPEMPPRQILLRFIATQCGLRYTEFKNAGLASAEEARLMAAARAYGLGLNETDAQYAARLSADFGLPELLIPSFDVLQGTNQTVPWIEAQIELHRPDLVIVDSFYRLKAVSGRKNDADWKAVTTVSRELKNLAMSTDVTIIGTHQLNRDAEGKIGTTGNLALADAVGQDADLILRVVTGRMGGADRSALFVLGGREVPFDGILINNVPCSDFSEIALITNKKQVLELMQDEDEREEQAAKEGARTERKRKRAAKSGKSKGMAAKDEKKLAAVLEMKQVPYDGDDTTLVEDGS
jgi:replicative DNA helicase